MIAALNIIFCILTFATLAIVPGKNILHKIVQPTGFYIAVFGFVFFLIPSWQQFTQTGRFSYLMSHEDVYLGMSSAYLMIYFISSIAVFVTLKLPKVNLLSLSNGTNFDRRSMLSLTLCGLLFLLGLVFVLIIIAPYLTNYSYFMTNRINILSGYGYQLSLLNFSLPLLLFLYIYKGTYKSLIFVLFSILTIIIFLLVGSRTKALIFIPYLILAFLLINPVDRLKYSYFRNALLICLAVIFVAMSLITIRDAIKADGFDALNQSGRISVTNVRSEEGNSAFTQIYQNYGHNELLAYSMYRSSSYEKAYGATFYAAFVSFVPRSVWPGKPLGGGPMLANIVAPGSYNLLQNEGNSSLTTGLPMEGYLNFGWFGAVLMGIAHGILLVFVTNFSGKVKNTLGFVLYLNFYHYVAMVLLLGEFLGVFSSLLFLVLPLLLIQKFTVNIRRY